MPRGLQEGQKPAEPVENGSKQDDKA